MYRGHWQTDIQELIQDILKSTSYVGKMTGYHLYRYIEEGNMENETHLDTNYSLICKNKT